MRAGGARLDTRIEVGLRELPRDALGRESQAMPESMPIPGRVQPTRRRYDRQTFGRSDDWRWMRKKLLEGEDRPGTLICPRCHAISDIKRWYFDEARYQQLRTQPGVGVITCPGCERQDRTYYEGIVRLRSPLLLRNKRQALGMIYNTEERESRENPIARLAAVQDHGEEIAVLTTTPFLAERIGKEFKKAFDGRLRIDHLPREKFSRVWWERE